MEQEDVSDDHENELIDGLDVDIPIITDDKEIGSNLDKDGNIIKRKRMRKSLKIPLTYV